MSISNQHDPVVLVCGADDDFAQPMAVTIYSALDNLDPGWPVELYIVDGGIRSENKRRVERVVDTNHRDVRLHWASVDRSTIADLPPTTDGWVNASAYLRLFTPEVVPETHSRAIYLDSDLLVETSLSQLWSEPFGGTAVLAVQDYGISSVSSSRGIKNYRELGLPPETPYFNSGVLVLNLSRWRDESVGDEVAAYLTKYEEDRNFNDMEGLNAVLSNDWKALDLKWNVTLNPNYFRHIPESPVKEQVRSRSESLFHDPYIYHFSGPDKPWKIKRCHPAAPRWFHYLWRSGWLDAEERLKSIIRFYPQYYGRLLSRWILEASRPLRHWVARKGPAPLSDFLRR